MKNRTKLFIACLIIGYSSLFTLNSFGQSYKVEGNKVIKIEKTDTTKKADKVFSVVDGKTFYKGSKGGVYYWKKSKKTGKDYKCYVK